MVFEYKKGKKCFRNKKKGGCLVNVFFIYPQYRAIPFKIALN